jgi:hypothetical protein
MVGNLVAAARLEKRARREVREARETHDLES